MRERTQNFRSKAVYYRKNYEENGKSKSKWVKIEGVEIYPARSTLRPSEIHVKRDQYEITNKISYSNRTVFVPRK